MIVLLKYNKNLLQRKQSIIKGLPAAYFANASKKTQVNINKPFQQVYYPLKKINFENINYFPIFIRAPKEKFAKKAQLYDRIVTYGPLATYIFTFQIFWDTSNYLHYIPITLLALYALRSQMRISSADAIEVRALLIGKKLDDFVFCLKTELLPQEWLKDKIDVAIPSYTLKKDEVNIHVKLNEITQANIMGMKEEEAKDSPIDLSGTTETADFFKKNRRVLFYIKKYEKQRFFFVDNTLNGNDAFSEYVLALGTGKKLIRPEI